MPRPLLLALCTLPLLAGCAADADRPHPADPRLHGYAPWAAPATDTLVDIWYLSATPEEFDRYWLTPQPLRP